jgi:hypothetical protein
MPTASTIPLVIVSLIAWRLAKGNLLAIVLFVAVFGAASALDIGDQGVAPWIFVLVIGLWFKFVSGGLRWSLPEGTNRKALLLVIMFIVYAVSSGIAFPIAFKGVHVVAAHMLSGGELRFGSNNISQICYLLACLTVFILGLTGGRESLRKAVDWYVYGCVVGAAFSAYQYLNAVYHIPYPSAVLYSGHHAILTHTAVTEGAVRLNSTFDEVSALAPHMAFGLVLVGWDLCIKPLRWSPAAKFAAMLGALLASESTTGYLCLMLVLVSLGVLSIHTYRRSQTISSGKIGVMVGVVCAGLIICGATDVPSIAAKAFQRGVLDKDKSLSYKERTGWNVSAMETAKETYFIGAGLGSVRCSSLEYGTLATLGAFGCFLFAASFAMQFASLRTSDRVDSDDSLYGKALLAALIVFAAMSVAGNELADPTLWTLFAAGVAGPTVLRPRIVNREGWQLGRATELAVRNLENVAQ